jgi:hypothetical protein
MIDMMALLLDSTSETLSGTVEKTSAPDEVPQGGSDPKNFLGGWKPKKWGRSRPIWSFFRRAFFLPASFMSLAFQEMAVPRGAGPRAVPSAECRFYLLH